MMQYTSICRLFAAKSSRTPALRGSLFTEYGLVTSLIAMVAVVAVTTMGSETRGLFCRAADKLFDVPLANCPIIDFNAPSSGTPASGAPTSAANEAPAWLSAPGGLGSFTWGLGGPTAGGVGLFVSATDETAVSCAKTSGPEWLTVDPTTGELSITSWAFHTSEVLVPVEFSVTATDSASEPLSVSGAFSLIISLPGDCGAILAANPLLASSQQYINVHNLGGNAAADEAVSTYCSVEEDAIGGADVAWTMVAVSPSYADPAADGVDPVAVLTPDAVSVVSDPLQDAPARLSDVAWMSLGDVSRVSLSNPAARTWFASETTWSAPDDGSSGVLYLSYGDKAWTEQTYAYARGGAFTAATGQTNVVANPTPDCATDTASDLWSRGRGIEVGDCLIAGMSAGAITTDPAAGTTAHVFGFINDRPGGAVFVRFAGVTDRTAPPKFIVSEEDLFLTEGPLPRVTVSIDLSEFVETTAAELTWSMLFQDAGKSIDPTLGVLETTIVPIMTAPTSGVSANIYQVFVTDGDGRRAWTRFYIERKNAEDVSCDGIYRATQAAGMLDNLKSNQFFSWIDIDGASGPAQNMRSFCHVEVAGPLEGGWTAVAFQREDFLLPDWDAGISVTRGEEPYFDTGFALSAAQLPPHADTAFGRRFIGATNPSLGVVEILDAVEMAYSTGDIALPASGLPRQGILNPGASYDVHRGTDVYYSNMDPFPGKAFNNSPSRSKTLTFDRRDAGDTAGASSPEYTWAYTAVFMANSSNKGYAYGGYALNSVNNASNSDQALNFGWLVLVR